MREQILRLMMQHPETYYSGEQMARLLHVTRAAIWKHIDALKKMGCEIECKPNRGYRLVHIPDVLQPEILGIYDFSGLMKCCDFKVVESTPSTNELAKQLAAKGAVDKTIVIAESQTEGKGRMGRTWQSEKGSSLTFSMILRPQVSPVHASKIGLMAGVSVAQAIHECTEADAKVKWPNDVLIGKKKVCGILTEMSAECDTIEYIVCGIGINVNQTSFSDDLMAIATSLRQETGRDFVRGQLLLSFLTAFFEHYDAWMQKGDFTPVITEYTKQSMLVGQTVTVDNHGEKLTGLCVGFDKDGFLVISKDGKRQRIMAGDVSIRSENTYV